MQRDEMRITLGGKYWRRRVVNRLGKRGTGFDGDCGFDDDRDIRIRRGLDERNALETEIHEALHGAFPWLREWIVTRTARELARLLWRLGYRKAPGNARGANK